MKLHNGEKIKFDSNRILNICLWILLSINISSLFFYQFRNMRSDFFHEAAYPYLYALSDLDSNSLFNKNFSGREIAPISWTLVAHVLLFFGFKLTFLTVTISNIGFLIFAIVVLIWFGYTFELRKTQILLLLVLFTTIYGVRPFKYTWLDQVWIWPMNSYGIYELFSIILCVCSYRMIASSISADSFLKFMVRNKFFLIPFFLFGLNHNRGLLEIFGPVGFTLFSLTFLTNKFKKNQTQPNFLRILLATSIVTLTGRFLIGVLTFGIPQYWQQASQNFTTLDQSNFLNKLFAPFLTIFQVFGMSPIAGQPVVSSHGIKVLSLLVFVIMTVYFPIWRYSKARYFDNLNLSAKYMFLHLIYFVLVGFLTALFTNSAGVIRYFIPLAISALFFVPFIYSEYPKKQTFYTLLVLAVLIPNILSGAKHLNEPLEINYRQTSNYLLTKSLLERDLTYGFAGPWTENVLTIPFYSEGKIHISLIDVAPIGPHLHAYRNWFLASDHSGRTFIAFPSENVTKDSKLEALLKRADSHYVVDKWTVLIYSFNPSKLIGQLP